MPGTSDVTGVQFVVSGGSISDQVVGTASPTIYGWIAQWDSHQGTTPATHPGATIRKATEPTMAAAFCMRVEVRRRRPREGAYAAGSAKMALRARSTSG